MNAKVPAADEERLGEPLRTKRMSGTTQIFTHDSEVGMCKHI